jgi:hypothetical protein
MTVYLLCQQIKKYQAFSCCWIGSNHQSPVPSAIRVTSLSVLLVFLLCVRFAYDNKCIQLLGKQRSLFFLTNSYAMYVQYLT